jgi:hypothetical protein
MMRIESSVENIGIQQFAGTANGIALLEGNDELQQVVTTFAQREDATVLEPYEHLGKGQMGVVAAMGDLAIKIATTATNTRNTDPSKTPHVDNLVNQFTYMTALGMHLDKNPAYRIHVPRQHFAFTAPNGSSMLVQERLYGVETLKEWRDKHGAIKQQEDYDTFCAIQGRIQEAVRPSHPLFNGLNDLGVRDWGHPHLGNLLVPVDTSRPERSPVFIIDQPGNNRLGALAARTARTHLRDTAKAGNTRPYIRQYRAR